MLQLEFDLHSYYIWEPWGRMRSRVGLPIPLRNNTINFTLLASVVNSFKKIFQGNAVCNISCHFIFIFSPCFLNTSININGIAVSCYWCKKYDYDAHRSP